MDISAFSEENFVVQDWINDTFRSIETQENKEAFVSSMVSKLQLYVQQVNNALEETSQQVLQNLPRIMHDAEAIHKEAFYLKEKMQSVKEEIAKIERDTGESISSLERLDKMKCELEAAKQALHEADNWTLLAADIEDVFELHDIDALVKKVVGMEGSLRVLSGSQDFESRRLQLEGYKNRLEAIASPHLVTAFTNANMVESKKFVEVFRAMGRLNQLVKYYARCRKAALIQEWRSLTEVDHDHGVAEWLTTFYNLLLDTLNSQVKWCQEVFGEWEVVARLYCDALGSLDPSPADCLATSLKQAADPLSTLASVKSSTDRFMADLSIAFQQHGGVGKEVTVELYRGLYWIYGSAVSGFRNHAETWLVRECGGDLVESGGDLVEKAQGLGQATPRLMAALRRAHASCIDATHLASLRQLLTALQNCLYRHVDQYRSLLREVNQEKDTSPDWSMFRVTLTLLQSAGELLVEVEGLEREIVLSVGGRGGAKQEEDAEMRRVLLSKQALQEFNTFVASIKEAGGERKLLGGAINKLEELCKTLCSATLDTMLAPVMTQLDAARTIWPTLNSPSQPDYTYAPLEYITQIGEYMMTLPQHLEPFVLRESGGLGRALAAGLRGAGAEASPADALLGAVARASSSQYADALLSIHNLSPGAAKQLAIDIGYLGNVLEDLGFGLSETLAQMVTLVKLPAETYHSESVGCNPRLVATIRQMRNITST